MVSIGQELLNTPFADLVSKLALALAEGQKKLDEDAISLVELLASKEITLPNIDPSKPDGVKFPLIALGFQPTFLQFRDTLIEVKMAITMAQSNAFEVGAKGGVNLGVFAASVNASYSNKYDFKAEGSSTLRTSLVAVPPPVPLEKYMQALIEKRVTAVVDAVKPPQPGPQPQPQPQPTIPTPKPLTEK